MSTLTDDRGLMAWWRAGTPEGRRALMAGSLGWMLDSFDVMLYALVLAALMRDLGMAKLTAGLLGSVTLVASAVGGLVFGVVADRYGRTRALSLEHPHLLRVHRRVRTGADRGPARRVPHVPGPWHGRRVGERRGAGLRDLVGRAPRQGARLHAERVGRRLRRWRRSSWPWSCPIWGWRAVFFVGVLPALLTVWVQRRVEEPALWRARQATERRPGGAGWPTCSAAASGG